MRNTRKITELENRQRVNVSNISLEAKLFKNEGTTVKAIRGAVISNSVIKAPNVPEDLIQRLWERDQLEELIIFVMEEMNKKLDKTEFDAAMVVVNETLANKAELEHTHTIYDITDYVEAEAYDDTEIKKEIAYKSAIGHKHTVSEITDYAPYDDSAIKASVAAKAEKQHK